MAERSLRFDLVARDKSFGKTLDQMGRKGEKLQRTLGQQMGRGGDESGRRFSAGFHKRLGGGFAVSTRLAKVAAGSIAGAFAAVQIGGFLKGAIEEAREAAKVGRQTNAVIKATGGVANVTAKDVDRLAGSLMRKVAVDDDVIATGANMLLTFKGVRNEVGKGNNIFDQATVAALDMTAAMNKGEITQEGLQASTIRLGRALNDPLKGMTALTRVGVTFTEGQRKQIKALVEAGDKMGAQKIILKELKSEFGGAAKAAVDPWQRVKVVMGELKEQLGTALLPVVDKVATWLSVTLPNAFDRVRAALQTAKQWWDDNRYSVLLLANALRASFAPAADSAASSTDRVKTASMGLGDVLDSTVEAVARLSQGWNWLVIAAGETAATFGDVVIGAGYAANAIDKLSGGTGHAADEVVRFGRELKAGAIDRMDQARGAITSAQASIDGLATSTGTAATAADRHAAAMRNQKTALGELQGALDDEKSAEIDLRQAKLNVSVAQKRVNDLKKDGKKGSHEYRQAQLDLERAQIAVRQKTDEYKTAQAKANAATSGAMRASQQATPQVRRLGEAARTGGGRAGDARVPWRKLGEDVSRTYREIHNKTARITAKFGWQGLQVFNVGGGLKAMAAGGRITDGTGPTADDVIVRASKGETVVSARDSADPGFQSWAADRGIPGYATGGRIPRFGMQGAGRFVKALGDWDVQVAKVMSLAASRFKQRLEAGFGGLGGGGGPGGWRWQMAALRSAFPGLALISGFRPGAITATGNRSYHAMGRAVDVPPRMDVFNWIRGMFGKRTRELIFSPAGGRQVHNGSPHMYSGITRANHWDHVHWAYDKGGWLMPGQVGVNNTSKPERVMAPGEPVIDRKAARMIAEELAAALRANPAPVYLDRQKVSRGIATANLWEARR